MMPVWLRIFNPPGGKTHTPNAIEKLAKAIECEDPFCTLHLSDTYGDKLEVRAASPTALKQVADWLVDRVEDPDQWIADNVPFLILAATRKAFNL